LLPGGGEDGPRDPRDVSGTPEGQAAIAKAKSIFGQALTNAGIEIAQFDDGDALDKGDLMVIPLGGSADTADRIS